MMILPSNTPDTTILECHSRGDKRFSALCARLASGHSIEVIYQASKRDEEGQPYLTSKGIVPAQLLIGGRLVPHTDVLRHELYLALWHLYFREHPAFLEVASQYTGFRDIFDRAKGFIYTRENTTPYPTVGACCQAAAIAHLVGCYNHPTFTNHMRVTDAITRYWTRYHHHS